MKKYVLFFLMLWMSGSFAQNPKIAVSKINSFAFAADTFLGYDKFGWKYFIINNTFNKEKDSLILQYKNLALGKITKVDLQNPLKIMLFYENFNTVILLDNQLNETQKISFSENQVPIVVAGTGMAAQNRLWIYNSLSQQIGLFDYLKNEYKSITVPFTGKLKYYESDFNYFQWIDENHERFACDVYGKMADLGKLPDFDRVRFASDNWILYSLDNQLFALDIKNNKPTPLSIPEKSFKSFTVRDQILSIFTTDGITNYKIILP
ncbi:hypothetical protein FNO01nite_23330 [Flavobacterium noncentrifugens]|uniref:Glutamine cyclotransferase n=1 Tax=Flavobacterium noncentrifugens TaxID=1128970 RepID=A0A1G9B0S1_9FLAO|nr:hypothetical protein [Flavobacterium noncentrifugens]GEP51661.1 hypothetical protein FNO01nite_23330 [Flavobacterium noncentrifugens]SDK33142.1 hypothetical protein SAMN04487935_3139 [Flavobacterium noncentrifugens]